MIADLHSYSARRKGQLDRSQGHHESPLNLSTPVFNKLPHQLQNSKTLPLFTTYVKGWLMEREFHCF